MNAITQRLRCDCEALAKRLRFDCEAIALQLRRDFNAITQRICFGYTPFLRDCGAFCVLNSQ
jgi:hypothetical protein